MIWSLLLGALNPIASVINKLADARVDLAKAATDQERIHAEERIKSLEAQHDVLIAEGRFSRLNMVMRGGFALPFVIYNAKLVLWDKVLGWGSTDALSAELFQIEMICIGFYFVSDITRIIKQR